MSPPEFILRYRNDYRLLDATSFHINRTNLQRNEQEVFRKFEYLGLVDEFRSVACNRTILLADMSGEITRQLLGLFERIAQRPVVQGYIYGILGFGQEHALFIRVQSGSLIARYVLVQQVKPVFPLLASFY